MQKFTQQNRMRRTLPALAKKSSRGYFMIELALALVVSTMLLTSQVSQINEAVETSLATATGQYMVEQQSGLNKYQIDNLASLQSGSAIPGFPVPLKPTTSQLITEGYLPAGFSLTSPLGLTFVHEFKLSGTCPGTNCLVSGLSHSTTGYTDIGGAVRNDLLGIAVAKIGIDGSQSFAGSGGAMSGYAGGYSYPAANFGTVVGALGIRIGDNSGINSLLNQFYKLDGSRPLQGTMNANNNDIINIKDITSTGTSTLNDTIINGSLLLAGAAAPGTACVAGDAGKLKKKSSGDGLVICNNNVWTRVGDAVSGISPGGACAANNMLGTDPTGIAYVCNGNFWASLSNFANLGDACAPAGRSATSATTNEQLICKNGQYIKMSSMLAKNVQVGPHIAVQDGTIVPKPTCDIGGTPNYSLALTQSAVDVSIAPPFQSTYVAAQNNGASWTVLLKLKKSAADGGAEVSGSTYGLSALMTLECSY